jgi:hypothetical protein
MPKNITEYLISGFFQRFSSCWMVLDFFNFFFTPLLNPPYGEGKLYLFIYLFKGKLPLAPINFQVQYLIPSNYLTLANNLLPLVSSIEINGQRTVHVTVHVTIHIIVHVTVYR